MAAQPTYVRLNVRLSRTTVNVEGDSTRRWKSDMSKLSWQRRAVGACHEYAIRGCNGGNCRTEHAS